MRKQGQRGAKGRRSALIMQKRGQRGAKGRKCAFIMQKGGQKGNGWGQRGAKSRRRAFIMRKVSAMDPPLMSSVMRMYGSCFVQAPRNWTALGWCTCAHTTSHHYPGS